MDTLTPMSGPPVLKPTGLPLRPATLTTPPAEVAQRSETVTGYRSTGKRAADRPPRRSRHRMTLVGSAIVGGGLLVIAGLDGTSDALVRLSTGVGWSFPFRWWLIIPALAAFVVTAIAWWLPPWTKPTVDWEERKRSERFREIVADDEAVTEILPAAAYPTREKTLAEIGLESALASAEAEIVHWRERALALEQGQAHTQPTAPPQPPTADQPFWSPDHVTPR